MAGSPFEREIFFDEQGLIVHRKPSGAWDGGDTAQREGWYWFGVWLRQHLPGMPPWDHSRSLHFEQVLGLLEPGGDGLFYRHPKQYPNPRDKEWGFSRDQMVPLVAAMAVWGQQTRLRRLWNKLPEDLLGKHAFNGNWRNLRGDDGQDCDQIRERVCTLKTDSRDCTLKVDRRDCSLKVDNRDCSLKVDTRNCGHDIPLPWGGSQHVNDPVCERDKAAQNAIYKAEHDKCEADKAAQNAIYKAGHDRCEAEKAAQNAAYRAEYEHCQALKAAQNAQYQAEYQACLAQREFEYQTCRFSNVHSGDFVGPATVNLFHRAMGDANPDPVLFAAGEAELRANVDLRIIKSQTDRDETGDDLNLIVLLLMSKLVVPTPVADEAARIYAAQREDSYGSYFGPYRATFGDDLVDFDKRVREGVASGWQPDVSAVRGAVRWYHRPSTGANPLLAELYGPIIDRLLPAPVRVRTM